MGGEGEYLIAHEDPIDTCKALRQLLEAASTPERLRALWQRNLVTLALLRRNQPALTSAKDQHYADILTSLYKRRLREMHEEASWRQSRGEKAGTGGALGTEEKPKTTGKARTEDGRLDREGIPDAYGRRSNSEIEPDIDERHLTRFADGQVMVVQRNSGKDESEKAETRGGTETPRVPDPGKPVKAGGASAQIEIPDTHKEKDNRSALGQRKRTETKSAPGQIDKSALPISAPRRIRDKDHLRYVSAQPCLICGRSPGHAHHLRFAQPRALGRKVSDEWVVPLCATHHRALHSVGDEERWWKEKGIDAVTQAYRLWLDSRQSHAIAGS